MNRAPCRVIASSLADGAVTGAIAAQGMLRSRAHHATSRARLPAEAVRVPCSRPVAGTCAMALAAPRIFKEPMGWKISSLSQISAGQPAMSKCSGGVRITRQAVCYVAP